MSTDARATRIRGLMLKPLNMPTWLIVLLLGLNALTQLAFSSKFGVLLTLSGMVLFFCTPNKTGGDGFWSRKTFTVWGVPILILLSGGAAVVISMVAAFIALVIYGFLALLLVFLLLKAWRNQSRLQTVFEGLRSFGR